MRKIINSTYVTLDGGVENPQLWPNPKGPDTASFDIQMELLQACDTVLMGRRTYESFASVWPTRSGDVFSDRMNAIEKQVVSTTLTDPVWRNTRVIEADAMERIRDLKNRLGADIVQYGLGALSWALFEKGLIDEVRLWIHPLILGRAGPDTPHFRECPLQAFDFVGSRTLGNGIIIASYACTK